MRYTRYDYKKKKGDNFLFWLIFIIALSIVIGIGGYNIILNGNLFYNSKEDKAQGQVTEDYKGFVLLQCGVYNNKDNANTLIKSIPSNYLAYLVEDGGNYKIMIGPYLEEEGQTKSTELQGAGINNFRVKCKIPITDSNTKAEAEIIQGYIKVINKLLEKDVKSINTIEFKEWVSNRVKDINNKDQELQKIIDNVNKMPEEYKKENINDSLSLLYGVLLNYKAE